MNVIPLGIAECCREWIIPLGMGPGGSGGSRGLCGERPVYRDMLPEDEWLTV